MPRLDIPFTILFKKPDTPFNPRGSAIDEEIFIDKLKRIIER
jgi:hypothetical protein